MRALCCKVSDELNAERKRTSDANGRLLREISLFEDKEREYVPTAMLAHTHTKTTRLTPRSLLLTVVKCGNGARGAP